MSLSNKIIDIQGTGTVVSCTWSYTKAPCYEITVKGERGFSMTFRSYTAVPIGTKWAFASWIAD